MISSIYVLDLRSRKILGLMKPGLVMPNLESPPLVKESNIINLSGGGEGRELCPATPSPNGETLKLSLTSDQIDDSEVLYYCETPTQSTFNPFAPARGELPPTPKKMSREFKMPTRRKLNFDTRCDFDKKVESAILDEDDYVETICKSILELVISNRASEIISDDSMEGDVSNGVKTPASVSVLTGIAGSCPGAPLRLRPKSRMPDQSICRKLNLTTV